MKTLRFFKSLLLFSLVAVNPALFATHGMVPMGFGTKASGMGGAEVAYAHDAILGVNPAGMSFIEDRWDSTMKAFNPGRRYTYSSSGGDRVESGSRYFPIPEFGVKFSYDDVYSYGLTVVAAGGLNVDYPRNNPAFGTSIHLGANYGQVIMAPAVSARFCGCQSIGVAALIGMSTLKIWGLDNFSVYSSSPRDVSDRGQDWNFGAGFRIGWNGYLCSGIMGGVAYSTRVFMSRFNRYKGLLADQGRMDIPATFHAGLKWEATPCTTFAGDYVWYFYDSVRAFSHSIGRLFNPVPLGDKNGPGFGWRNVWVGKLGVEHQVLECFTVRAGWSFGRAPYTAQDIDPNIVAPSTIRNHITVGGTWDINDCSNIDFHYAHSIRNEISGESRFGLGTVSHMMYQHEVGINYGRRF